MLRKFTRCIFTHFPRGTTGRQCEYSRKICISGQVHHRRGCSSHSVDEKEIDLFNRLSKQWWRDGGKFQPLRNLNELRVPLIRDGLISQGICDSSAEAVPTNHQSRRVQPLSGMTLLDVGCGGGLLSEPLGRLGASVIGLDAAEETISAAKWHASLDPTLDGRVQYECSSVEEYITKSTQQFDGVIASEIMEHVSNPPQFVSNCCSLVKPGGSLFITTLNKTWLSYALGIVVAEQVLRLVPSGAHDWNKFIPATALEDWLTENGFHTLLVHGMILNPLTTRWSWIPDTSVNYAIHAVKPND